MELEQINNLIDKISKSNFSYFELEFDGMNIKMEKLERKTSETINNEHLVNVSQVNNKTTSQEPMINNVVEEFTQNDGLTIVTSPIVGTFYQAASPDAPPFVSIGKKIKKGEVLCIIESMKLMNEIESEVDGVIIEILVKNSQPVEYGTELFKIRES